MTNNRFNSSYFKLVECKIDSSCVDIWIPPVDDPEGELITTLDKRLLLPLVDSVKKYIKKKRL